MSVTAGPRRGADGSRSTLSDAVTWIQIGGCGDPPVEGCVAVPDDASYAASIVTRRAIRPSWPSSSAFTRATGVGRASRRRSAEPGCGVGRRCSRTGSWPRAAPPCSPSRIRQPRGDGERRDRARAGRAAIRITAGVAVGPGQRATVLVSERGSARRWRGRRRRHRTGRRQPFALQRGATSRGPQAIVGARP